MSDVEEINISLTDEVTTTLLEVKSTLLLAYDLLEVMNIAIEAETLTPTSLIGPIGLVKKELLQGTINKLDLILNI